jgi:hypothetical protein
MVKPRIRSLPAALGSLGGELVELGKRLGYTLDGWQRLALNDLLATNEEGVLAAFEAVLLVGRQNGKSLLAELYAVHFATRGETVMFTCHRADTAKEIFRRLLASLPDELEAAPTFTNGKEQIAFPGGGVILFRTRGPRVGRGFTIDKLIVDECQICDREALDAVVPALRTRPGAQVLYLGCAPDARTNGNCDVIHELRERAKAGTSESLCYLEWSAGFTDAEGVELQAHELSESQLDDETQWLAATPASESGRITLDRMRIEREALDASSFSVEYLTVGIWPESGAGAGPISVDAWQELVDAESELYSGEGFPEVVIGIDVSPARQVSVALVGRREDDLWHADFVGRFEGVAAGVRAVVTIFERDDVDVRFIVADGEPANLDLLARLKQEYIPERVIATENASRVGTQACGALVDLVNEERLRHRGQLEIAEAIRGATVKTFSDSWMYSRSRSRSDVSPLLATAVALWKAEVEIAPVANQHVVMVF